MPTCSCASVRERDDRTALRDDRCTATALMPRALTKPSFGVALALALGLAWSAGVSLASATAQSPMPDSLLRASVLDTASVRATRLAPPSGLAGDDYASARQPTHADEALAYLPGAYTRLAGPAGVSQVQFRGLAGARLTETWAGLQVNDPQLGSRGASAVPLGLLSDVALGAGAGASAGTLAVRQDPARGAAIRLTAQQRYDYAASVRVGGLRLFHARQRFVGVYRLGADARPGRDDAVDYGRARHSGASYAHDDPAGTWGLRALYARRFVAVGESCANCAPRPTLAGAVARLAVSHQARDSAIVTRLGLLHDALAYTRGARSAGQTQQLVLAQTWRTTPRLSLSYDARALQTRHSGYERDPGPTARRILRLDAAAKYRRALGPVGLEAWAGTVAQGGLAASWYAGLEAGFAPSGRLSVAGRAQRLARLPNLDDLYWAQGGTPSLRPETGVAFEAEAEYRAAPRLTLGAVAYARRHRDFILWLPATPFWRPVNLARATSSGLEVRAQQTWGGTRFGGSLTAEYALSTLRSALLPPGGEGDRATVRQLPFRPVHRGTLLASARRGRWHLATAHRVAGRQYSGYGAATLAAHVLARASLEYRARGLGIGLAVDNLYDARLPAPPLDPTPFRRASLTVTYLNPQPLLRP